MCGICGFYGRDDNLEIKNMCRRMKHRGPDEEGYYIDDNISLANVRLSIIDLKTGRQPIYNEDESVVIVYNGESYNFKELREKLEDKHEFYTNSDTEVIVHAYEEYGIDFLKKLEGMFALAIYDKDKKALLLARDYFGIKPLYFSLTDSGIVFASEIKAMLEYIVPELNQRVFADLLSLRYNPHNETLFKNIYKLPPACYLTFNKEGISIRRYWKYEKNVDASRVEDLLVKSVKKQLISDVPLGVFLSGGVDSSLLVSIMRKFTDKIETFSVGFEDFDFNETSFARFVAEELDCNHREVVVKREDIKLLPKLIYYLDEPIGDAILIPTYILSELAKKHVKVVLTGEGADEIFGGYIHYKAMKIFNRINKPILKKVIYFSIKNLNNEILNKFFNYPSKIDDKEKEKILEFLKSNNLSEAYDRIVRIFSENEIEKLLKNKYKMKKNYIKNLNDILIYEIKNWLPNCILLRLDKITMANSIEGRVPYLSQKIYEITPISINDKMLLRKIAKKYLPKKIVKRKKQAFFVPIEIWINDLKEYFFSEFSKFKSSKYIDKYYIEKILNRKSLIYSKQVSSILAFELWYRIFIDEETLQ